MIRLLIFILPFLLTSCDSNESTSETLDDLAEARQRWESLNVDAYTIDQSVSCECIPPYFFSIVVAADTVHDVILDASELANWEITEEEFRMYGFQKAFTVDEFFQEIEKAMEEADLVEAEYDAQYGFPTSVYIDWIEEAIDDEILYRMSNLRF